MGVQFVHLFALSVWVGGIVVLAGVVTPALTLGMPPSGETGERLMREIHRRFNTVALVCAVFLLVTGLIKFVTWEHLTPWNGIRYLALVTMSALCFASALKGRSNVTGAARSSGLQDRTMLVNLLCGMTVLLMA